MKKQCASESGRLTYAEILSRAAANIEGEIDRMFSFSKDLKDVEFVIGRLRDKLDAIQSIYLIETGDELQLKEFKKNEQLRA